jgi:hypothetical protein
MGKQDEKKSKLMASIQNMNKKKTEEANKIKTVIQETKIQTKMGRPSNKLKGIKYVKVGAMMPEDTKIAMQKAMLDQFRGVYSAQDEFIADAIEFYIKNYK